METLAASVITSLGVVRCCRGNGREAEIFKAGAMDEDAVQRDRSQLGLKNKNRVSCSVYITPLHELQNRINPKRRMSASHPLSRLDKFQRLSRISPFSCPYTDLLS